MNPAYNDIVKAFVDASRHLPLTQKPIISPFTAEDFSSALELISKGPEMSPANQQRLSQLLNLIYSYLEFICKHFPRLDHLAIPRLQRHQFQPMTSFFDLYNQVRLKPSSIPSNPAVSSSPSPAPSSSSSSAISSSQPSTSTILSSSPVPLPPSSTHRSNDHSPQAFTELSSPEKSSSMDHWAPVFQSSPQKSISISPITPVGQSAPAPVNSPSLSVDPPSIQSKPAPPSLIPSFSYIRLRHLQHIESSRDLLDLKSQNGSSSDLSSNEDWSDWDHEEDPLPTPPRFNLNEMVDQQPSEPATPKPPSISSTLCPEFQQPANPNNSRCLNCGFAAECHDHDSVSRFIIKFNDLVFEKEIGSGKFAKVWKGRWVYGGAIAIKFYRDSSYIQDFRREIKGLSKLRHPNILLFIGACVHEPESRHHLTEYFVVTELCQSDLPTYLRNNPRTTLNSRLQMAIDACLGMNYLHSIGLVHCDLKTENLLVRSSGVLVIGDLGCTCPNGTRTGVIGTLGYIAPELILEQTQEFTFACDVFSFAMILFELFASEQPWSERIMTDHFSYMGALMRGERPFLSSKFYIPDRLRDLMSAAWHDDPAERPSFIEILKSLLDILSSLNFPLTRTQSLPTILAT